MDELEILKKDWKKDENSYPTLSYNDIYKMILKKSSSIVKWIFIISILEFLFWLTISLSLKLSDKDIEIRGLEDNIGIMILSVLCYGILVYFFYRFYINYKTINTTDNAKKLMENIIKTRRTVKQYVLFNLIILVVSVFYMTPYAMKENENYRSTFETAQANGELLKFYAGIIISIVLVLLVVIGVLLLFYWLIYGLLLKHLNTNYKELKKLDV